MRTRRSPRIPPPLQVHDWVVYAKPPFGGPAQVLAYLGRYTHRVALSNDRLVSLEAGEVRFRWKDYAHAKRVKTLTLSAAEFLRRSLDGARDRFLLHVLPAGCVRIRHFGCLANRTATAKLARCRALLVAEPPAVPAAPESVAAVLFRLTGVDLTRRPACHLGDCASWPSSARATSRPRSWTPHEAPGAAPPLHPAQAPLCVEGRWRVSPQLTAGPPEPPPISPSPRSPPGFLALVAARPFPPPQGSDTIPIACSPAVQFNPVYPASLARLSLASSAQGPPDKSLFVGHHNKLENEPWR